jgi:aspartyl-tRNA(Asn)/glutamyl-tRNA(Gln) amidotransferase subunit A
MTRLRCGHPAPIAPVGDDRDRAPEDFMPTDDPLFLSAIGIRDATASGRLTARAVATAFADRVRARDDELQAFTWFDRDDVLRQADDLDTVRAAGVPPGPLHGVPVAIKDVIDTAGIPTRNGTPLDEGRVPTKDAAVVGRLRTAGAVILGKTVTAELAYFTPGPTRNPHHPGHTPGGSSSGSAAAVGAGLAPLALGTQTAGSVIRPASFCGVVGFKPTFGAIDRTGILLQSDTLDTVGLLARTVADAGLLAGVLAGDGSAGSGTRSNPPRIAVPELPFADRAEPETRAMIAGLARRLGTIAGPVDLPDGFGDAPAIRDTINAVEMARHFEPYARRGWDRLSGPVQATMARGRAVSAGEHKAALDAKSRLADAFEAALGGFDVALVPAAPGPAPAGLGRTGDPIFNGVWTLLGVPAITIPAFLAANGLPVGVQLVGRRGDDASVLAAAAWMERFLAD